MTVVRELPPSRLWGMLLTTVHTKSFKCCVSTARHFFLWNIWSTQVYPGDPDDVGSDFNLQTYYRVVYAKRLKKEKVYAAHRELCCLLNRIGEDGYPLQAALGDIFGIWYWYGAIRPMFMESWIVFSETALPRSDFVERPFPSWLLD